jgi:hypothetical protein
MVGGLKNEKRDSIWSFAEIDQEKEGIGSHQSKTVNSSQSAAPHQPGDREG